MKKEPVKHTPLRLSPLETRVCATLLTYKNLRVIDIANIIFKGIKKKPKSASNSVTSAIRQINRKCEKANSTWRILGKPNGRGGKLVEFHYE